MSNALTLQDLVAHVMDVYDLTENDVDIRRAVRASVIGYEMATTRHQWSTYDSQVTAYFNDKYDTGTIDIDSAGVVTLTGGTFPAWSNLGSIYLNEERLYRVDTRDSDTQVTLENWTGQTETGSAYALRQDRVYLDEEVRQVYDAWNESEDWSLKLVDPMAFREWEKPTIYSGADPHFVTFRSVFKDGLNKTELRVGPGVSTAVELDIAYSRRPRSVSRLLAVRASASSDVVTLTKPLSLAPTSVGSMVRYSSTRNEPTADQTFGVRTPQMATFEGIVSAQASTTSITVPGIPDFTDKVIVVTDILDIPAYVQLAVQMYAEAQMARIGRGDIRDFRVLLAEADEQLRYAMEQDAVYVRQRGTGAARVDHLDKTIYVAEN